MCERKIEMKMIIKPGEGGDDAKMFQKELTNAYLKYFDRVG